MNVGRVECPDDNVPCWAKDPGRKFEYPAGKWEGEGNESKWPARNQQIEPNSLAV